MHSLTPRSFTRHSEGYKCYYIYYMKCCAACDECEVDFLPSISIRYKRGLGTPPAALSSRTDSGPTDSEKVETLLCRFNAFSLRASVKSQWCISWICIISTLTLCGIDRLDSYLVRNMFAQTMEVKQGKWHHMANSRTMASAWATWAITTQETLDYIWQNIEVKRVQQ